MTAFQAGPLTVYAYGLALAAGALAGFIMMSRRRGKYRITSDAVEWFAMLSIPLGVLGARLLYFLVSISWFLDRGILSFFAFSRGGYMLYGAMAGAALAAWTAGKITRQPAARILDAAAAPFALFTAVARGAEYFAGIGLGEYVEDWFDPEIGQSVFKLDDPSFLLRFPFAVQDADEFWRFPVFMLEALAALVFLVILLRARTRRDGAAAMLFLGMYAGMQPWFESLRIDLELRWGFVKVNQIMTLPALCVITVWCVTRTPRGLRSFRRFAPKILGILGCCGVIMAMEFALEGKIGFLRWMNMGMCWFVMLAAAVGMTVCACRMILNADRAEIG